MFLLCFPSRPADQREPLRLQRRFDLRAATGSRRERVGSRLVPGTLSDSWGTLGCLLLWFVHTHYRFPCLPFRRYSTFRPQIDRNGACAKGRLAQLLTEGTSPNPRWLIKFDAQPFKDEEMYEKALGKLLYSAEDSEWLIDDAVIDGVATMTTTAKTTSVPVQSGTTSRRVSSTSGGSNGSSSASSISSDGETGTDDNISSGIKGSKVIKSATGRPKTKNRRHDHNNKNKGGHQAESSKQVSTSDDNMEDDGEEGTTSGIIGDGGKTDRANAREARSKRRQAKIDEEIVPEETTTLLLAGSTVVGDKRKLAGPFAPGAKKLAKLVNGQGDNGEVVTLKLKTGTLFMNRGLHRRAEFVPRL